MNKTAKRMMAGLLISFLGSCIYVDNTPGPPGHPGDCFFGVDYEDHMPYSYWDDNPAIPYNPSLGSYYPTAPGLYRFEYHVNPWDYWYGTYEIFQNPGGPGGSHGEPGYNGADSYLMLICDPYGYHEHRFDYKTSFTSEPLVIEERLGNRNYRITIQRATEAERPSQAPKFKR